MFLFIFFNKNKNNSFFLIKTTKTQQFIKIKYKNSLFNIIITQIKPKTKTTQIPEKQ